MAGKHKKVIIQQVNECLIPVSLKVTTGDYRRYWDGTKGTFYHRYVYEQMYGEIPEGKVVHHLCHNPSCCNPEHLVLMNRGEHNSLHKIGNKNNLGKHFPQPYKLNADEMQKAKEYYFSTKCSAYKLADLFNIGHTTALRYIRRWKDANIRFGDERIARHNDEDSLPKHI